MPIVRVVRVLEETVIGPDGKLEQVIRISFMVGPHGPFTERFPKADFDPQAARRRLDEVAAQLAAIDAGS
jgi:hypothetical protein